MRLRLAMPNSAATSSMTASALGARRRARVRIERPERRFGRARGCPERPARGRRHRVREPSRHVVLGQMAEPHARVKVARPDQAWVQDGSADQSRHRAAEDARRDQPVLLARREPCAAGGVGQHDQARRERRPVAREAPFELVGDRPLAGPAVDEHHAGGGAVCEHERHRRAIEAPIAHDRDADVDDVAPELAQRAHERDAGRHARAYQAAQRDRPVEMCVERPRQPGDVAAAAFRVTDQRALEDRR